jgi:hypothetical protein
MLAAVLAGAGGCAKFDSALGQRWAVVQFAAGTPVSTQLRVRAACSHIPGVTAEPLPSRRDQATMSGAVRYRTDNASDASLARLQQCVQRFRPVTGIDFEDSGSQG